jgi:hypothetical protein
MKRVAIATAWVWVALAQPASAHARSPLAQDRAVMRGALERTVVRGSMPEMCAITPSVAPPPFAASPSVASNVTLSNVSRELTPQAPLEDSPIAWCATPDDPRCSSRDASSLPGYGHGQVPLNSACGVMPPAPRARAVARISRASQLGAARDGRALRVERPPRAALRRG